MSSIEQLSDREKEILRLVATGLSNKEISRDLVISINTVKVHLRNIYQKLEVASRTEATYVAIQAGLVLPNSGMSSSGTIIDETGAISNRTRALLFWRNQNPGFYIAIFIVILVVFTSVIIGYQIINASNAPIPDPERGSTENIAVDRWEIKSELPFQLENFATSVIDNQIYAVGGESESGVSGGIFRYTIDDAFWERLSDKPVPVTDIDASVIGNKLYLPGGKLDDRNIINDLAVYDPILDQWMNLENLPEARSGYSSIAYEGRLYLFGGWDGENVRGTIFIYDPINNNWTVSESELPQPIMNAGIAVANGRIFIIGGENQTGTVDSVYVYNPSLDISDQNSWSEVSALENPRANMAVVSLADLIYIFGGAQSSTDEYFGYQYSPSDDIWQPIESPMESGLSGLGAEAVDTYIYLFGGSIASRQMSSFYAYKAIYTIAIPVLR